MLFIVATKNARSTANWPFQNIFCGYNKRMDKNERGRPPKADDERKDNALRIRMTKDERESLDQAADGKTSSWARDVLLKAARRKNH